MLLNFLQCTGQSPATKTSVAPGVTSTTIEKPWSHLWPLWLIFAWLLMVKKAALLGAAEGVPATTVE